MDVLHLDRTRRFASRRAAFLRCLELSAPPPPWSEVVASRFIADAIDRTPIALSDALASLEHTVPTLVKGPFPIYLSEAHQVLATLRSSTRDFRPSDFLTIDAVSGPSFRTVPSSLIGQPIVAASQLDALAPAGTPDGVYLSGVSALQLTDISASNRNPVIRILLTIFEGEGSNIVIETEVAVSAAIEEAESIRHQYGALVDLRDPIILDSADRGHALFGVDHENLVLERDATDR